MNNFSYVGNTEIKTKLDIHSLVIKQFIVHRHIYYGFLYIECYYLLLIHFGYIRFMACHSLSPCQTYRQMIVTREFRTNNKTCLKVKTLQPHREFHIQNEVANDIGPATVP